MFKRRSRARGPRPTYKWFGGNDALPIRRPQDATLANSTILLRPNYGNLDGNTGMTLERILLHMQVCRTNTDLVTAFSFLVAKQQVNSVGNLSDLLEPLGSDPFVYANTDILHYGALPVPRTLIDSLDVFQTTGELIVADFDIKARRKMSMAREAVTVTINADIDLVLQVQISWRLLMRQG